MSDDQEIHVEDLCTEKKYFSQIPNIIHRMGLGCYVVAYYCLLKSIAGDSGHCFTGQKKLAKSLGCSDRHIRKMNAFMSKPFEILGGKPLIKITYRKNEDGEPLPNLIHVTDIWLENVMVLNEKKPIPQTSMSNEKPKIKKSNVAERNSTPPEPYSPPPDSSSYKEEPFKKNPSKNIPISSSSEEIPMPPSKPDDACGDDDDDPGKNIGENIWYRRTSGQMKSITQSEIYRHFIKLPFSTETLKEAISRFRTLTSPINTPLKYIESICVTVDKEKEDKPSKDQKTAVKDQPQESTKIKQETMTIGEYLKCRNKNHPSPSEKT